MKNFTLILLVGIIFCANASAQQLKLNNKITINLFSIPEQVNHTINIQLPKSSGKMNSGLPVIILLDAQDVTLYEYASSSIDRLMYTNDIPEAIFVGIAQTDRTKELSVERNEESSGKFLQFLQTDLTNYLKENYRVSAHFTFIGHSLGGQFLTSAMTSDPVFFRSVISISGALNYPTSYTFYQRKVLNRIENFLTKSRIESPVIQKYYFTAGSDGFQDEVFRSGALTVDSLLKKYPSRSIQWKFDYLPGYNHMTTPLHGIPAGLIFVFNDWHFSDSLAMEVMVKETADPIETIRSKNEKIRKIYGTSIRLPYNAYAQFTNYYLSKNNLNKAQAIGQEVVTQYPENDESYALLATIFTRQGNNTAALQQYKIAQSKSDESKYKNQISDLTTK